jgi:NADH-quinone oxidoreductase subunit M
MLMGPVKNTEFLDLPKVTWYEVTGIMLLLIPMIGMGVAPLWLSDMTMESVGPFIQGVLNHL